MKVWKQKLAAAVLAGMLLGAGCTEELDPRPPSAELTATVNAPLVTPPAKLIVSLPSPLPK